MNKLRSLVQADRTFSDPDSALYSDHMLAELLALHEEMILQLRLERLEVVSSADFLTCLIDQHEKTVAMLRARLENCEVDAADGVTAVSREARSDAEKFLVTSFAGSIRATKPPSLTTAVQS